MLLLLSTLMLGFMHVWGSSTWSGGLSKRLDRRSVWCDTIGMPFMFEVTASHEMLYPCEYISQDTQVTTTIEPKSESCD